jgi:hypothetical protein
VNNFPFWRATFSWEVRDLTEEKKQRFPMFPHVRKAYGMDINMQEYFQITGLSDMEQVHHIPGIVQGDWSNNWVPGWESDHENNKKNP